MINVDLYSHIPLTLIILHLILKRNFRVIISLSRWGVSSADRARHSHCRGRGFDSRTLHHFFIVFYLCLHNISAIQRQKNNTFRCIFVMAGPTRLERATSSVTGRRSNQLSYEPLPFIVYRILTRKSSSL